MTVIDTSNFLQADDIEKVYKDLLEISKSGKVENPYRYFGLRKDGEK